MTNNKKGKKTMATKHNLQLKRLATVASKDVTKSSICQVYKDNETKAMVSTDGHRIIQDKSSYDLVDTSFDSNVYLKTGHIYPINEKYPTSIAREYFGKFKSTHKELPTFKLPEISKLSNFRKPFITYFKANGEMTIMNKPEGAEFALDLRLLDVLSEREIKIWYKDPLNAVTIEIINEPEVLMVVMPCRV